MYKKIAGNWLKGGSTFTNLRTVAKLKFNRSKNIWQLYWIRASGKWQIYHPSKNNNDLSSLVKEIEIDEFGCFFG
ncbi:MAG: DUF3024 domain-containing protein [Desulfuromonadales bacterium]